MWVGLEWMRPSGRFSRLLWFVSVPVAAFLIWFGWTEVGAGATGGGMAVLVIWTVGIVAMEAWKFRTMYLGRGRHAAIVQRAMDERDPP